MTTDDVSKFSSTTNIVEKDVYTSKISLDLKHSPNNNSAETDDYDPLQQRNLKHPVSDARSLANLIKSCLGTGILAMPAAFKNSGYVVGIIGTIVVGYMCTHAVQIFVRVSREVCKILKTPSMGYAETCEAVIATGPKPLRGLASFTKTFTDWAMAFTYLGACFVYVVLLTDQLQDIVSAFYPDLNLPQPVYSIIFLVPFLFLVQIRNLKNVAVFSVVANILMLLVFAICLYYIFIDLDDFKKNDLKMTNHISKLPLYLTTVIFALEGIGVIMPIENGMKTPQHFLGCPGVLNISMGFIVIMYCSLGLLGYMKYGDKAEGSITLNLPHHEIPAILGKVFIIVAIFFTYILQFYVPIEVIWRNVKKSIAPERHNLWQILIRVICVLTTFVIGLLLPNLEQVIGLVGAVFYASLGLIIPAFIEIIYEWDRDLGKFYWRLWKNIIIMLVGFAALIFGSIQSIRDMFQ